jgi:hypothetical protein
MVTNIYKQIKNLKNFRIAYELTLCDPFLAKLVEKFYTVHIKLMKDWGHYNEKDVKF